MRTTLAIFPLILFCLTGQQTTAAATIDAFSGKPCARCHRSKLSAAYVHGALTGSTCTPCHKVTNGNHQADHWLAEVKEKGSGLCYECHENRSRLTSVHQPIRDNDCLCCHTPHSARTANLLRFAAGEFCLECHQQTLQQGNDSLKTAGFRNRGDNLHYLHAGRSGIACLTCHDPHASEQNRLIRPKVTIGKDLITINFTPTSSGGSCATSCHDRMAYARD